MTSQARVGAAGDMLCRRCPSPAICSLTRHQAKTIAADLALHAQLPNQTPGEAVTAGSDIATMCHIAMAFVLKQPVHEISEFLTREWNTELRYKSGTGTAYLRSGRMFEPRHNILSNVRAAIRKYVVTWLKHLARK